MDELTENRKDIGSTANQFDALRQIKKRRLAQKAAELEEETSFLPLLVEEEEKEEVQSKLETSSIVYCCTSGESIENERYIALPTYTSQLCLQEISRFEFCIHVKKYRLFSQKPALFGRPSTWRAYLF